MGHAYGNRLGIIENPNFAIPDTSTARPSTLLHSLFKYRAWANEELFAALERLDPVTHQAERHDAIRILNHIYGVDRIFASRSPTEPSTLGCR